MHQDHVTSRGSILDDLKRYSVNLFDAFVETSDTRLGISGRTQIAEVRVPLERSPELRRAGPMWRPIFRKPPMHQTMRSAENVHPAATWSDVRQHRV